MQKVSPEYVESMKSIGRNRGYIKVTLGIVNAEAQEHLEVSDSTDLAYFSQTTLVDGAEVTQPYATCEQNWSKVDGSMYFLPTNAQGAVFYNNGLVGESILSAIAFDFGGETYDVAGFTIDFGDNYPIDFTISNGTETITITDNDKRYFTTEQGIHDIQTLTITATRMSGGQTRLRIYSLSMGVSNTFTNENTLDYTETSYVSPIADTLPSTDVSIRVVNYDNYYNPDNPNSILAFFEVGQEVRVQFGYDTNDDGEIEWLPETVTHLKSWGATDSDATFTATDKFDYLQGVYYGGKYNSSGTTLYNLAVAVLTDAGITDYKLDTVLKEVTVVNPLPTVAHTEALQIIANAGRCTLREDRDGKIYIESTFIPEYTITSNGETDYSNVENIKNDTTKIAYALTSNDFSLLSDSNLLFMDEENIDLDNIGYVSSAVADANGDFATNPVITLNLEANYAPTGFNIRFRNVAPQEFVINTYLDNVLIDTIEVENPDTAYSYYDGFNEFNKMVIEFTKGHANSRITIDKLIFGAPTDYTIERYMIKDSPTATRQDRIKSINMTTYNYKDSAESIKDLVTSTIKDAEAGNYTFHFNNPSYGFTASVTEGTANISIVSSSSYEIVVALSDVSSTDVKITIQGYEYAVDEQIVTVTHNATGIEQSWSNPLISNAEHAQIVEAWLSDFYLGDVEYELNWRGDPRIDADDLLNLELKSGDIVSVRNYQNTINFNGAWSGSMKARKVAI